MKTVKIALAILVLLAFPGFNDAFCQWTTVGANMHNTNTGNVGIGNFPAATLLHVGKNMTEPIIRIENFSGPGGATFQMMDNASGADWKFKATATGGFKIRDNAAALDVITIEPNSAANSLCINGLGQIGLGTSAPLERLHIEGNLLIGNPNPFIYMYNFTPGGNAGISFKANSGIDNGWIFYDETDDVLRLNASSVGSTRNDLVIKSDGRVCIGTTTAATGYALSVAGKAICTELLVKTVASWPDYVFAEDYDLMSLPDLEESIRQNNHLPGIPSASEVEENGILIGDMQKKLLEKMEEMTLYIIAQDKQIEKLTRKVETLENENQVITTGRSATEYPGLQEKPWIR